MGTASTSSSRLHSAEVRIEIRVREAEISLAEEMAFHARCRGVRYRERYKEFMLWDCLRQRHTGRVAPRPPLVLAVKLDGKLNKWPGDAEAPPILVSSELCAESGALEYPLHLL